MHFICIAASVTMKCSAATAKRHARQPQHLTSYLGCYQHPLAAHSSNASRAYIIQSHVWHFMWRSLRFSERARSASFPCRERGWGRKQSSVGSAVVFQAEPHWAVMLNLVHSSSLSSVWRGLLVGEGFKAPLLFSSLLSSAFLSSLLSFSLPLPSFPTMQPGIDR